MGGQVDVGRGGVQVDRMRGGEINNPFMGRKMAGGVSRIGIGTIYGFPYLFM